MARKHLNQRGHNLFSTTALVLAGLLWLANANPIAQVINCGLFVSAAFWWINKSSYAKKAMVYIFGEDE